MGLYVLMTVNEVVQEYTRLKGEYEGAHAGHVAATERLREAKAQFLEFRARYGAVVDAVQRVRNRYGDLTAEQSRTLRERLFGGS